MIVPFTLRDLPAVLRLERRCFDEDAFDADMFLHLFDVGGDTFWIARQDDRLIGYLAAYLADGMGYIASIAVDPDQRGQGLGRALMRQAIAAFRVIGVRQMALHVRFTNGIAIHLYRSLGFARRSVIARYYEDGTAAVYMVKTFGEEG